MNALLRLATAMVSPAGEGGRLSAFIFHRALERPDPLLPSEPDARMLDRLLGWIAGQFRVLDPLDACDRLFRGTLPARPAIVTFDDGYQNNFTIALPLLQKHRIRAAFFIASGYLGGGVMFNDRVIEAIRRTAQSDLRLPDLEGTMIPLRTPMERRDAIERILNLIRRLQPVERDDRIVDLERQLGVTFCRDAKLMMMSPEQVAALHRAGMCIGGHTRTHPILLKLDSDSARDEISGGLDDLERITGSRPRMFAFPNGRRGFDYDRSHVDMLRSLGVDYAFTTHPGVSNASTDRHEMPRFTPWERSRIRFGARAWLNLMQR